MRPLIAQWWRYIRAAVILVGVGVGITAFLWIPISLVLVLWFGGSAVSALHSYGRTDALVAHGRWTNVSPSVFCIVFGSEALAITSTLTLFACLLVMWLAKRRGDT
jgi:hypothetical protein